MEKRSDVQHSLLAPPLCRQLHLKPFGPASSHPIFEVWWRIWTQLPSSIAHLMFNNPHCHQSLKKSPSKRGQMAQPHDPRCLEPIEAWPEGSVNLKKDTGFLLMTVFSWPLSPSPRTKRVSIGRGYTVVQNLCALEKISQWQYQVL